MQRTIGYVAVLDVLGFTALIQRSDGRTDGASYLDNYLTLLDRTLEPFTGVTYVVFSDNIVLTTNADEETDLIGITAACAHVMWELLGMDIAIRGAIAHGPFIMRPSVDRTGTFVAGGPVIEAYRYEKMQNWVGVILAPSVRRRIPDLGERIGGPRYGNNEFINVLGNFSLVSLLIRADVPVHPPGAQPYDCLAVIPCNHYVKEAFAEQLSRLLLCVSKSIQDLQRMKPFAPDPEAQGKLQSTITWLSGYVLVLWGGLEQWCRDNHFAFKTTSA